MSFLHPALTAARANGQVVTSDWRSFWSFAPPVYGITGSDGKTTTTSLIAAMLRKNHPTVHIGGNIGAALLPMIDTIENATSASLSFRVFS